jgi:hypothetical protein
LRISNQFKKQIKSKKVMNKKQLFTGIFAIALVVAAGYGVKSSMNDDVLMDDLVKAHIEALANGESGNGYSCKASVSCGSNVNDYVECTGVKYCLRGRHYVECDDKKSYC